METKIGWKIKKWLFNILLIVILIFDAAIVFGECTLFLWDKERPKLWNAFANQPLTLFIVKM